MFISSAFWRRNHLIKYTRKGKIMFKKWFYLMVLVLFVAGLAGCAAPAVEAPAAEKPADQPAAPASDAAALKVTGMVNAEQAWTDEQLKAMETTTADSTNKAGETTTYTGVAVGKLLELAGIKEGAATVAFVADDGFTSEQPLADVLACADCIVGFRDDGKYQLVMPGFPGNAQVKGLVEINLK
jgi:DMSO/TMAO reductase YedYZ molybdopterin-dependent catalytic subunit